MTENFKIPGELIRKYRIEEPIYVTQPRMPDLHAYQHLLEKIWQSRWLTNDGQFHQQFEARLKSYLGIKHANLFVNGTIALLVALQALRINSGEVITTPFTFPATVHVLPWNRVRPVFCDIEPKTYNIDPKKIESLINPDTKAIMAVHVYGIPCDVEAIQEIADRHGLHVIYDAAHAFGVKIRGRSILEYGDLSALSFHATKLFNSIEGGALVGHSEKMYQRIRFLKNFGIAGEETVIGPGINGKMNEFQAAFGLLELEIVDQEIQDRKKLARYYQQHLDGVRGLTVFRETEEVEHNYAYFPILVDCDQYGCGRDVLCDVLRACNIYPRKYFYPLCSNYPCYAALPSADPAHLPTANRIANQILCLPLYGNLDTSSAGRICDLIQELSKR